MEHYKLYYIIIMRNEIPKNVRGIVLINPHLVVLDHLAETGIAFADPTVELWYSHPSACQNAELFA